MKKYFAIFAAIAILGMLAIYFVPDKQLTKVVPTTSATTQPSIANTQSPNATQTAQNTNTSSSNTRSANAADTDSVLKNGTFDGNSISTRFGTIQVAITVSSGKITNVDFLKVPEDDMRSSQISNDSTPLLESQTISAQSASIDGVSGATYTTRGYIESLQSAIDAAKS